MLFRWTWYLCVLGLFMATRTIAAGDDSAPIQSAGFAFFEAKVRPILVKHCYECHSERAGAAEGDLKLDSRSSIRVGGSRGAAVVPGDVTASWLLKAVAHEDPDLRMPPKRPKLSDSVVADLKQWIVMGAPDPREHSGSDSGKKSNEIEGPQSHWAYQKLQYVRLPSVPDPDWPRQALDHFIASELQANGLVSSPDSSPEVLLRRVHFDLVGLPPSLFAMDRFRQRLTDSDFDVALEREVDELLSTPQFGERWGRHWLDVARFAESSGKEANISFPYAWRYRDYVIDAVNADLPYGRFILEQMAGDLLSYDNAVERARLLIATGFLAVGPKNLDEMNKLQFAADVVDEQIDVVTRAILGSSVACARCHDHKFDPITMQDYYGLAGIFSSTKTFFGTAVSPANRVGGDPLPLPRAAEQPIFHQPIPAEKVTALKAELAALQAEQKEKMANVFKLVAAGKDPGDTFTIRDALRIFWRSGAIEGQLEKVDEFGRPLPLAMGVLDNEQMSDAPLLERGEVSRPSVRVPRRFPQAFGHENENRIGADQSGRLDLAHWLANPTNPLTARVFVNRVWHHLFGAGIVASVDNFGTTGDRPSHPELLDHLTHSFNEHGGSLKQLVRSIVLSRAYRQSSGYQAAAFQLDPENRLLWRASKRRLEAEAIRDAMLAASGELDQNRPSGSLVARVIDDRPISLIGLDKRLPADLDGAVHRSVYLPVIRDRLPDALDLFDFAEPSLVTGRREVTNVPTQSLYLLNSPFVQRRAEALANRLRLESSDPAKHVRRAVELCFCREADEQETLWATEYLNQQRSSIADESSDGRAALVNLCQAFLTAAEFRILD